MGLTGDLSTLDLTDLLQNAEMHRRSGTIAVEGREGTSHLYIKEGTVSLFAKQDRPGLIDALVASALVTPRKIENARSKRRGSKKSLGETLVEARHLSEEQLIDVAVARLTNDACELITSGSGGFTFHEGTIPRGVFDPEERRLDLGLPIGPLLLEAARRQDHWQMVRQRVPSDSTYYVVDKRPKPSGDPDLDALAERLLERIDGTRTVAEVMLAFPHWRFNAFELLASWCEQRCVRPASADDLAKLADETPDLERGLEVIARGLEANPHDRSLLNQQANLAEKAGHTELAIDAVKLLLHMKLESGDRASIEAELLRAKRLAPEDTSIWERSLALAIEEGRVGDAVDDGLRLADLYRAPGLHNRVVKVLESLLAVDPNCWEVARELAHAHTDCGDLGAATALLERHGKRQLALENYPRAKAVYLELLALDPKNERARQTIDLIDSDELAQRRAQRLKLWRRVRLGLIALVVSILLGFELAGRLSYRSATRAVGEARLIEQQRYAEAISFYERVRARHPYATSSWIDARGQIKDLLARQTQAQREAEAKQAPPAKPATAADGKGSKAVTEPPTPKTGD